MSNAVIVPSTSRTARSASKRTITLKRPVGPMVIDIWEPRNDVGASPVLMIHGWGGTGRYLHPTAAALAETVRVIVPDLPGTGRSQPVRTAQNMYDQVSALEDLLDHLDLTEVQVIGHSMGGAMALLLANARPAQINRVVLTSLSFFVSETQEAIYDLVMRAFTLGIRFRPRWLAGVPGVSQLMASRYFYRIPNNEELLRLGLLDYLELDGGTAIACAANAADQAIPEAGSRLQVPALLIACRQDQVMPPQNVAHTAAIIPHCQVRWIDRCGHMPMVEKPQTYLKILQEFLLLT